MSHTNSTTNYSLPQFITTDKPAWLTDVNNAYTAIDTAVYNAQTKADTAFTNAGDAQADATAALTNAAAADAKGAGALASIEVQFDPTSTYSIGAKVIYNSLLYRCTVPITTPGAWTGAANWERITVDSIIPATAANLEYSAGVSTKDAIDGKVSISDLATVSQAVVNPLIGTGTVYYKRLGKMIIVYGNITTTSGVAANTQILGNIPSHTIPGYNHVIKAINNDGTSADWVLYQRPGESTVLNAGVMTGGQSFTISYVYYSE